MLRELGPAYLTLTRSATTGASADSATDVPLYDGGLWQPDARWCAR